MAPRRECIEPSCRVCAQSSGISLFALASTYHGNPLAPTDGETGNTPIHHVISKSTTHEDRSGYDRPTFHTSQRFLRLDWTNIFTSPRSSSLVGTIFAY